MTNKNYKRYSSLHNKLWRPRLEAQLYSFFKHGTKWGWVLNAKSLLLSTGERSGTQLIGGWVSPRACLDRCWTSHQHCHLIPVLSRVKWAWLIRLLISMYVWKKFWKKHTVNAQLSLQWRSTANNYQQQIIPQFGNIKQTFCIKIIIHKTTLKLMPHAPQQAQNLHSADPLAWQ